MVWVRLCIYRISCSSSFYSIIIFELLLSRSLARFHPFWESFPAPTLTYNGCNNIFINISVFLGTRGETQRTTVYY